MERNRFRIAKPDLLDIYMKNHKWTWRNTLAVRIAPPNPDNWGDADLAAAILNVIQRDGGPVAMQTFWQTMGNLPPATTQEEAMMNFLLAAKAATGRDYKGLIRDYSLALL